MTKSISYDLGYIAAALETLESYLLSRDLFWPVGGRPPSGEGNYPVLTPGGVLLSLARLRARRLSPANEAQLQRYEMQLESLRERWRVAWEQKAAWDYRSRLRQWGDYLEEALREPGGQMAYYVYEVRLRVMLALLEADGLGVEAEEHRALDLLDARLTSYWVDGDFLWGEELATGFPQETFWYLWGKLSG